MKPIVCILAGHHGPGTGSSSSVRDEWMIVREDARLLFEQLLREEIVTPVLEPLGDDNTPGELRPRERSARWALSQKPAAVIELHYNSFQTQKPEGHRVLSSRMNPFVECMVRALDTLPNPHRDTGINVAYEIPRLMEPIPCVLLEPAFIFEKCVGTLDFRPMLVAAIKEWIYKYFEGGK